jgi:hypothetical protein
MTPQTPPALWPEAILSNSGILLGLDETGCQGYSEEKTRQTPALSWLALVGSLWWIDSVLD